MLRSTRFALLLALFVGLATGTSLAAEPHATDAPVASAVADPPAAPMNLSLAEAFARLPDHERAAFVRSLTPAEAEWLASEWRFLARPKQLAPQGDWDTWLLLAGRGFGKTRTGAEFVRQEVESGRARRIALVGPTAGDVRDVMVEGESGLLNIGPKWSRPKYQPSKRRLTWKNGAIATCFSADEPNRLRGPQHDLAWADELAAWRYPDAWDQLQFGLRLGDHPRVVVTTTPRPIPIVRELLKDPRTHPTTGTTYENEKNLAASFKRKVLAKYEGTRLGRQELRAEILDDTPGALWTRGMIEALRVRHAPDAFRRVVVAIDPTVSSGGEGDEAGIVVAGIALCRCKVPDGGKEELHGFILDDLSDHLSPNEWASRAVKAFKTQKADRIIGEANNGGALVEVTVRTVDARVPYKAVHAAQGKRTRAEPVAALYEQGKVHHVGAFPKLEDQQTTWVPASGEKSPDRMDAAVWALTELMLDGEPMPASRASLPRPKSQLAM